MSWEPPELKEWEPPEAQAPSPTGLAPLNPIADAALNAVPGVGNVKQVMEARPLRKFIGEGAAMAGGAAVATAVGGPEVAPIGAGVGNVIGGELSDITDHPERAQAAFNVIFNPAAPNVAQQLIEKYKADPQGTVQAVKQELSKAGERFTSGAVAQLLTMGVSKILTGIANTTPGAGTLIPGAKELLEQQGIQSDPSMFTTGKFARVLKGMANEGLLSSDKMTAIDEANKQVLSQSAKDIVTEMAGRTVEDIPPSELAQEITKSKNLGENLGKEISRRLFNSPELNGQIESVPVTSMKDIGLVDSTGKPLQKEVVDFIKQRTGGINVPIVKWKDLATDQLVDILNSKGIVNPEHLKNTLQTIAGMDDNVNFATAHFIRSELLSMARETDSPAAARIINQLVHEPEYGLSSLMDDAANTMKKGNPAAFQQYLQAKDFYRTNIQTFNNDLVAKMFVTDETLPEKVGRSVFKGGNTTQVQQLKDVFKRVEELVTDPANAVELQKVIAHNPDVQALISRGDYSYENLMNKVRSGSLQTLFSRYQRVDPESLTGTKINYQGILNDLDPKQNPEEYATLKELFPENQIEKLRDWAKAGYLAVQNNPESYSRATYWMVRILGGAMGGIAGHATGFPGGGFMIGEGATLLGEGQIASYLLTDPKASQIFTKGIRALANTKTAQTGMDLVIKAARTFIDDKLVGEENK